MHSIKMIFIVSNIYFINQLYFIHFIIDHLLEHLISSTNAMEAISVSIRTKQLLCLLYFLVEAAYGYWVFKTCFCQN